jgi:hypothetical protein
MTAIIPILALGSIGVLLGLFVRVDRDFSLNETRISPMALSKEVESNWQLISLTFTNVVPENSRFFKSHPIKSVSFMVEFEKST